MAKFLNETGLSHFWSKVKEFLKSKYVGINVDITDTDVVRNKEFSTNISASGITTTNNTDDIMYYINYNDGIIASDDKKNNEVNITTEGVAITKSGIGSTHVTGDEISAPKFVKANGTNLQVLLADGSIATLNAANGIPKLDANGRIPLSQLANLDTTLFQVVTALPTSGIKSNRIYLLKSSATGTQNIYGEYIYTGNVSATYDASKWEKLGEYKADIDLTPYSKKIETVNGVTAGTSTATNAVIKVVKADSTSSNVNIPAATQAAAGVMTGADKKALDTLTARYPLSIASFTVSPSLLEAGVTSDVIYSWTFNNTDFHPITNQQIKVAAYDAVTVDKNTKTYKREALTSSTTAGTVKATLTINNSLTKDVNITYHYPSYIGVVALGYIPSEANLKKLTKSIEWGKGKTVTLTTNNQTIMYAYPASYGDLTSIKDGNGFEGFAGYNKSTITFANGVLYNVYTQRIPATASSKYTFA